MIRIAIIFAVTISIASCTTVQDKEAASAYCECYALKDSLNSASMSEMVELGKKQSECMKQFRSDYDGKISKDGFSEELKKLCPEGHAKAEEMSMFD